MDIVTIAGFLGAGKTSMIIALAEKFRQAGISRIAVVENEISPQGVDNQILTKHGLVVSELYAGCICCQLKSDLADTLVKLQQDCNPELIIIEPTGVATPEQVREAVKVLGDKVNSHHVAVLIDALRCHKPRFISLPFINRSIEIADIVVLNKADMLESENCQQLIAKFKESNPTAPVFPVSTVTGQNIDQLAQLLMSENKTPPVPATSMTKFGKETAESFTTRLQLPQPVSSSMISEQVTESLQTMSASLQKAGCKVIGHLKVLCENKDEYLKFSLTDFEAPITTQGNLSEADSINVTVNAIVYGLSSSILKELLTEHFGELVLNP